MSGVHRFPPGRGAWLEIRGPSGCSAPARGSLSAPAALLICILAVFISVSLDAGEVADVLLLALDGCGEPPVRRRECRAADAADFILDKFREFFVILVKARSVLVQLLSLELCLLTPVGNSTATLKESTAVPRAIAFGLRKQIFDAEVTEQLRIKKVE